MGTNCDVQAQMTRLYIGSELLADLKSGISSLEHTRKQLKPLAGCRGRSGGDGDPRSLEVGMGGKPGGSMAGTNDQCNGVF